MRTALGLPPPERRLGQTAQDFVQAACADEVILVHCERRGGQPAVKSRWLWRLEMLLKGAGERLPDAAPVIGWTEALDAPPPGPADFAKRPRPCPPQALRPRELPVTAVERWVRDPYAVYAERILGLRKLDRPDASAEALARGQAVHRAVQTLVETWPDLLPEDCAGQIADWLVHELSEEGFDRAAMAREAPLARRCAAWLEQFERARRRAGLKLWTEAAGETVLATPSGPFTLTARADRIEVGGDGAVVLDFKTGTPPSTKQVAADFAPQLTLTAAILGRGGFDGIPVGPVRELAYVKLTGRGDGGELKIASGPNRATDLNADQMAAKALEGLMRRIARFDHPDTPYVSWAAPQFMGNFGGNYDHLARVWEWHVVGAEEPEAGE